MSACQRSMSSTKKARRLSLATSSPGGDAAGADVAVVAGAAAVAAGDVAVAVGVAAVVAACHGDVAASAKGTPCSNPEHNRNPSQHCATGWGPTVLAMPTERGPLVFAPMLSASQ
jgi:hypothetical protein